MESQKKKEQMCIFKSSLNRFSKINKDVPGPASYKYYNFYIVCSKKIKISIKENLES
jgi:hypothetical protein